MSVKASLLRRAALTLIAGVAIALPMGAKASVLGGLSIRAGGFFPSKQDMRDVTDVVAWGGGIEYKVPWFPRLLNGEAWSTSISADFHYSERKSGILRYFPVSINQVYTFEEQNGHAPYAGFCVTAATFGTTGAIVGGVPVRQPTVTRFGGGVILGLNLTSNFYLEGRYEWIDAHGTAVSPNGFRGYVGYRF